MKTVPILDNVAAEVFFSGMREAYIELLGGCATNVRFSAGEYIRRQGDPADEFFLVKEGRVVLEMTAGNRRTALQTIEENEPFGWSWLVPPYEWHFHARAGTEVRALRFDAACIRRKCEENPDLGYEMYRRFTPVIVERLMASRLQAMEVYT
jgi:CRP/FNR family transcriptional regulator, cyclic AMP receptor protein